MMAISHDDRTGAASDAPHTVQPAHMAGFIVQGNVVVQGCVHASGAEAIGDTPEAEGEKRVADGESNSATAVVRTLTAVIFPVPKRVFRRSLFKLDTIVPAAIIIE